MYVCSELTVFTAGACIARSAVTSSILRDSTIVAIPVTRCRLSAGSRTGAFPGGTLAEPGSGSGGGFVPRTTTTMATAGP